MRLDVYLCEKLGVESRSKAAHLIKMGNVKIGDEIAVKSGVEVGTKSVELISDMQFASMGGYKLEHALQTFKYDASGKICVDVGASNGGFTDCLLSHGAAKVFAIDVGECALPKQLKDDPRVVVIEKFNARELTNDTLNCLVDLAVIDVSFISLKLILPAVVNVLLPNADIIALVKPQFEVGKQYLNKKGIVVDDKVRKKALQSIIDYASSLGLKHVDTATAPLRPCKNVEYLIYLELIKNK